MNRETPAKEAGAKGSDSERSWPTLAAFATVTLLLGLNFVAVRFSNQELPPFWGATLRFAVAAGVLFGIVQLRGLPLPRGKALAGAVIFGVLTFGAMYALMYWALLTVASGMAAVMFASLPLLTLLMAAGVGMERLRWRGLLGAALAIGGIAIAFREQLRADVPLAGLLAVALAAACAALATVVVKRFPRSHPISTNAVAMAVGTVLLLAASLAGLLAASLAAGEARTLPGLAVTWAALVYLIASAIVAFVLMIWILARWKASAVSYTSVLQPLVTVTAASLLAGEQVTLVFLLGSALVLVGVYVGALAE